MNEQFQTEPLISLDVSVLKSIYYSTFQNKLCYLHTRFWFDTQWSQNIYKRPIGKWIYSWWTDSIYNLLTHIHVVRIAICKSLFHILDSQTRFYVICGKEKEFFNKSKDWERVWTFLSQMISIKIKLKSRLNAECVHHVFHFLFNIFGLFARRMFVPGFSNYILFIQL